MISKLILVKNQNAFSGKGHALYREELPMERESVTHKFSIEGYEGYLTVSLYEDRRPGEIFIFMNKIGSPMWGMMNTFAILASLALQYGIPLQIISSRLKGLEFSPNGFTSNPDIPKATSLVGYIMTWLELKFPECGTKAS